MNCQVSSNTIIRYREGFPRDYILTAAIDSHRSRRLRRESPAAVPEGYSDGISQQFPDGISRRHIPTAYPDGISRRHIPTAYPDGISRRHFPTAFPDGIVQACFYFMVVFTYCSLRPKVDKVFYFTLVKLFSWAIVSTWCYPGITWKQVCKVFYVLINKKKKFNIVFTSLGTTRAALRCYVMSEMYY